MTQEPSNKIRVLLVDDEEDLTTFLSHRLTKQGMSVVATGSGAEAIEEAEKRHFDVAVVDLKMPGMDGIECMERLKEIRPFLETIMLTGHGSYESALDAGKLRTFRYLIKPYEFDELLEQIRDAREARKAKMDEGFREESRELSQMPGLTPRELMRRQEELLRKYERS